MDPNAGSFPTAAALPWGILDIGLGCDVPKRRKHKRQARENLLSQCPKDDLPGLCYILPDYCACILTGYPIIPLPIHPPHFHKNDFIKMLVLLCLPHSGARHVLPLMIWWPLSVSPAVFSPVSSSHPGSLQFHGSYAPFHIWRKHLEEGPFLLSCSFCFVFAWVTSTQQFPFYEFIWRWTCTWVKRSVSKASLFIIAKDCSLLKVRQYS